MTKKCRLTNTLAIQKLKHKQTRMKFFRNLHKPENNTANETDKILQTQLTRNFAERNYANFAHRGLCQSLQNRPRTRLKENDFANQNQT